MEVKEFGNASPLLRRIVSVTVPLSLILPWASNWKVAGHWFLFGIFEPTFGFRFFQEWQAIWAFPFLFMILALFCAVLGLVGGGARGGISNVMSALFVLLALHYFVQIYHPGTISPFLTFNLPLSIGAFSGLLGASASLIVGTNELILWFGGSGQWSHR